MSDGKEWQRFDAIRRLLIDDLRLITKVRDTTNPKWELAEIRAFHEVAARRAALANLTIPTLDQVTSCDIRASGHIDWSTKLPLYVAEIMFDRSPLFPKATTP